LSAASVAKAAKGFNFQTEIGLSARPRQNLGTVDVGVVESFGGETRTG